MAAVALVMTMLLTALAVRVLLFGRRGSGLPPGGRLRGVGASRLAGERGARGGARSRRGAAEAQAVPGREEAQDVRFEELG
jgi:hypothetical protein